MSKMIVVGMVLTLVILVGSLVWLAMLAKLLGLDHWEFHRLYTRPPERAA